MCAAPASSFVTVKVMVSTSITPSVATFSVHTRAEMLALAAGTETLSSPPILAKVRSKLRLEIWIKI